jgi:hypothetical protein
MLLTDIGNYTITLTGTNPFNPTEFGSTSWNVEVIKKPCSDAEINLQTSMFVDQTYDLPLTPVHYSWTPPLATSDLTADDCGTFH